MTWCSRSSRCGTSSYSSSVSVLMTGRHSYHVYCLLKTLALFFVLDVHPSESDACTADVPSLSLPRVSGTVCLPMSHRPRRC